MFHNDDEYPFLDKNQDKRCRKFADRKPIKPPKENRQFMDEIFNHIINNELSIDQNTLDNIIDKYRDTSDLFTKKYNRISMFIKSELRRFYRIEILDIERLPNFNKKYIFLYNNNERDYYILQDSKNEREARKILCKEHMESLTY